MHPRQDPHTLDGPPADASHPPAADPLDLRILQNLRRIIRAVDIHSRKLAAEHDITGPQLVCLLEIADSEPVTATTIARQVHLSPSTVVGILDRLEAKGLVARQRDRADRRLVYLTTTAAGRDLVCRAPSPMQESLAAALEQLPQHEQARLADALQRLAELTTSGAAREGEEDPGEPRR